MLKPNDFYDQASGFYDDMTRFKKRQEKEREWFRLWRERYPFDSALDAGCGTGSHTFALIAEGVRAIGVDISEKMVEKARDHARKTGLSPARFRVSSFENLSNTIDETFDAVFCLGNSLAHLEPDQALNDALQSFWKTLNSGGLLVIQLLNFEKILKDKKRIIDIHREGDHEFIRFYDFNPETLNFNILHIDWANEPPVHELQTTIHYSYIRSDIKNMLTKNGFKLEAVYGNIRMAKYEPESSPNLVLAARRQL